MMGIGNFDRTHRSRFGRGECSADGDLSGVGNPKYSHHAGYQLGTDECERMRPRPKARSFFYHQPSLAEASRHRISELAGYETLPDPKRRTGPPWPRRSRINNYRLFADEEELHLVSAKLHLTDHDPFALFEQLLATEPKNMDPAHAFYLGYELCKAETARNLGKQYQQDESLDWGFLTVEEKHHRLSRGKKRE